MQKRGIKTYFSQDEEKIRARAFEDFKNCPIPQDQIFNNLGLFLNSKDLSRILFLHHIYSKIIEVQGVIFDFGTRWGQNMAVFSALRGIYEPFNRHRKVIGFDTFKGFPRLNVKDGKSELMEVGNTSVTNNYIDYLTRIMNYHEMSNPLSHINKYEIIKGDAAVEIKRYLRRNPQVVVALAYFDFDIYEPTKKCLEAITSHVTKGSILAFDELNDPDSPGETIALSEVYGLENVRLKRFPYTSRTSYFTVE